MKNSITQDKASKEGTRFIKAIETWRICHIASTYHDDDACRMFRPPIHGSFNVCFFVQFDNLDRWVVRIPLPSRVPWADEKTDAELATMR